MTLTLLEDPRLEDLDAVRGRLRAMLGPEHGARTWLVGGVVRDALLGRPLLDIDLTTGSDPERCARMIADAVNGTPFPLGDMPDEGGCWRVAARAGDDAVQYDVCSLRGESIEHDLRARDITANALAVPLDGPLGLLDGTGGRDDLDARLVRMVAESALDDDPLRMLRVARMAHTLGWRIDDATVDAVRARAHRATEPAGERTFAELRLLLLHHGARRAMHLLDTLGLERVLLPELDACRAVEQSRFHHLDVRDHTLAVLDNAEDLLDATDFWLPLPHDAGLVAHPWTETQRLMVLLAALIHDMAKPATRRLLPDGRVAFPGHDEVGVGIVDSIAERWRWSAAMRRHVGHLVATHLALGYLLHSDRGARERWRLRRRLDPVTPEAIVLSVADRLATAGPADQRRWVRAHLELARSVWTDHWREQHDGIPEPLLDGRELAAIAGVQPGPAIGRLVTMLAEAQAVGAVTTRADAERLATEAAAAIAAEAPSA